MAQIRSSAVGWPSPIGRMDRYAVDSERAALDALVRRSATAYSARGCSRSSPTALDGTVQEITPRAGARRRARPSTTSPRCAPLVDGWRRAGLAVPLCSPRHEFLRTLDVFPLEYGDIIASHVAARRPDPFAGIACRRSRPAAARCELQAKSHLIHLREGFIEAAGRRATRSSSLIAASAPAFRAAARQHRAPRARTVVERHGDWTRMLAHEAEQPSASRRRWCATCCRRAGPPAARSSRRRSLRATSTRASASGGSSMDGNLDRSPRRRWSAPASCVARRAARLAARAAEHPAA